MLSRRAFVQGLIAAATGGYAAALAACSPSPGTPFRPRIEIEIDERASAIRAAIDRTREPYFNDEGKFYLVAYNTDVPGRYVDQGVAVAGLMALVARCPHDGCRVPFCSGSRWFECPCGGDKFNGAGEYRLGPAKHGMDRMKMRVRGDHITVLVGEIVPGPPRGVNTTEQEKEGPFCV